MGRRIPTDEYELIHPVLSLTLFIVGMAASVAIVAGLCSGRFRRKPSRPPSSQTSSSQENVEEFVQSSPIITQVMATTMPPPNQPEPEKMEDTGENKDHPLKELPLPPKMLPITNTCPFSAMKKSASEKRLSSSLSMKLSRSLSMAKTRDQKEGQRKKGKSKPEESIWTKTIILGEKCKVPDEEEDDPVILDGKGNRVSTYHPKNSSSRSMSRQVSFNEPDLIPTQERKIGQNNE